jgi:hypothetical protein
MKQAQGVSPPLALFCIGNLLRLPCGEPSQSRCARQLPQRGSQGGRPLGWGCPLSLACARQLPQRGSQGGRPLRRGCPLSLACARQLPQGGSQGGRPLRRGCPLSLACARQLPQRGGAKGDGGGRTSSFLQIFRFLQPRRARALPLPHLRVRKRQGQSPCPTGRSGHGRCERTGTCYAPGTTSLSLRGHLPFQGRQGNPLGWGCPLSLACARQLPQGGSQGGRRGGSLGILV